MPVTSVTKRIAVSRNDSAVDSRTERWGLNASYHVVVSDPADNQETVLSATGIPALRDQFPGLPYFRVVDRNANRISPILWEVEINYQSPQGGGGGGGTNPLLADPIIEFGSEVTEEEITDDVNGEPILFVTGEEPSPRLKREFHTPLVQIKRNVAWVNTDIIAQYRMAVNSDTWYGNPPGTCLLRSIRAVQVKDTDFDYWTVDAAIAIRRGAPRTTDDKAWFVRVLAQGMLENVPDPVDPSLLLQGVIATRRGQPVTRPVLHDVLNGFPIDNNSEAEWYEFEIYESLPFAYLGLL